MQLTLTAIVDHAILDDEEMIRRDLADKLTEAANHILRAGPGWRNGAIYDDGSCTTKWRVLDK